MTISYEAFQLGWSIISTLLTLGALAWTYSVKRRSADAEIVADQANSISALDTRLSRIEERVTHLPTDRQISEIHDSLASLRATVSEMAGELKTTVRTVERTNTFLMERKSD